MTFSSVNQLIIDLIAGPLVASGLGPGISLMLHPDSLWMFIEPFTALCMPQVPDLTRPLGSFPPGKGPKMTPEPCYSNPAGLRSPACLVEVTKEGQKYLMGNGGVQRGHPHYITLAAL